jgi:hypothetical protein
MLSEQTDVIRAKKQIVHQQVLSAMNSIFDDTFAAAFDLERRIEKDFGIKMYSNQAELVETILDPSIQNISAVAARSGGKTFGSALGLALLCMNKFEGMPIKVGITAPKEEQANRVILTFKTEIMTRSEYIRSLVDLKSTTNTRVVWKNGSIWESFSSNATAREEGRHYDIILMDESQHIADIVVSQVLLPMIGHSRVGKVVKIGVPRCRNHFYRSAMGGTYTHLSHDWMHCPSLMNRGSIEIDGVKYPKSIVEKMPYSKKKTYFPNNPELWTEGDISEEDFATQYEMFWLVDADLALNENDQKLLLGNFEFLRPETEEYYFGLDLAGGSKIRLGDDRDYTSLSIGRIKDGMKQKVDGYLFQGDAIDQIEDIMSVVHPQTGKYRCKYGCADYGYNSAVVDLLAKNGVRIEGVQFGSRDQHSGKNMKNAMFDLFFMELRADRFKYPSLEYINRNPTLREHFDQWCILERHIGNTLNDRIEAPEGQHDDAPMSDILLNKAMIDKARGALSSKKEYKFPKLISGVPIIRGEDDGGSGQNSPFGGGLLPLK